MTASTHWHPSRLITATMALLLLFLTCPTTTGWITLPHYSLTASSSSSQRWSFFALKISSSSSSSANKSSKPPEEPDSEIVIDQAALEPANIINDIDDDRSQNDAAGPMDTTTVSISSSNVIAISGKGATTTKPKATTSNKPKAPSHQPATTSTQEGESENDAAGPMDTTTVSISSANVIAISGSSSHGSSSSSKTKTSPVKQAAATTTTTTTSKPTQVLTKDQPLLSSSEENETVKNKSTSSTTTTSTTSTSSSTSKSSTTSFDPDMTTWEPGISAADFTIASTVDNPPTKKITRVASPTTTTTTTTTTPNGATTTSGDSALSFLAQGMDVRRLDMLVHAGPQDFTGVVHEIENPDLDWNSTIFYTVTDPALTARLKGRFGLRALWPDVVVSQVAQRAATLPPQQYTPPPSLLEFMTTHCEFKNEHADGSFLDHLSFCGEYTQRYFPQGSPNVLLLHSIGGVNTNLFPLPWEKLSLLEPLLTEHEYLHVKAFPCMLRLLFIELVDVLWDDKSNVAARLDGITITAFHGERLRLDAKDFWLHLNYHLIHILDFLPTQNYREFAVKDGFTRLFVRLHELLRRNDRLLADVRMDRLATVDGMAKPGELPTWDYISQQFDPEEVAAVHAQLGAQLRRYSADINHDLSFTLHWKKDGEAADGGLSP